MLTRETLATLIDEVGLSDLKQNILDMAKPSIRMISTPVEDESEIPIGASKLGGVPDMPPGAEYPNHRGKALGFVAQINLADLPDHPERHRLPSSGLLQFYYRDDFDREDLDILELWQARLTYYPVHPKLLIRTPISDSYELKPNHACRVSFLIDLTVPPADSYPARSDLGLSFNRNNSSGDRYVMLEERCEQLHGSEIHSHLFGYPYTIQNDVLCEAYAYPQDAVISSIAYSQPEFHEWEMLAQIDSDRDIDMVWGDVGILYYCIKKRDLDAGHFDHAICIMQSC